MLGSTRSDGAQNREKQRSIVQGTKRDAQESSRVFHGQPELLEGNAKALAKQISDAFIITTMGSQQKK
eukprot:6096849-Pyramimonas_sp.AAC.1